jgi:Ca-activated chloride channel homolog
MTRRHGRRPRASTEMRRATPAAVAAVVCLAGAFVAAHGQRPAEVVRPDNGLQASKGVAVTFVAPGDGEYISGPATLKVQVQPADAPVRSVSLFADGRLVCTVERPPYECAWDAGPSVVEHALRAVAVLPDGQRVARAARTRGVPYAEAVDVDVVHVTATVTDGAGKFVRGLGRQAFRLFEGGARQDVTYFAAENVPLEIIVAVDVSGSMTDAMPQVQEATKKFLSALRPQDRVTVIGFNDNVFTLARPSADLQTRLRAIDRLAPWGGTALYDVIVQAVDQLGRQPGRRVLLVFTDGEDLNSHIPLETAERRLEASDVVLYPVAQGQAFVAKPLKGVLDRLAQKTGGRAFFESVDALDSVFGNILEELSNQYLLGYVPKNGKRDGAWRPLRVEVTEKSLRVRARQGYRLMPR